VGCAKDRQVRFPPSFQCGASQPKSLNPAEAPMLFLQLSSILLNIFLCWPEYGAMACIPMAYPPMSPMAQRRLERHHNRLGL
jgi:hypothetical protein